MASFFLHHPDFNPKDSSIQHLWIFQRGPLTFTIMGCCALAAAVPEPTEPPPRALLRGQGKAGACLTAKRINFIMYLSKATLLCKGNTLCSLQPAPSLAQRCPTGAAGAGAAATRVALCSGEEDIFSPQHRALFSAVRSGAGQAGRDAGKHAEKRAHYREALHFPSLY